MQSQFWLTELGLGDQLTQWSQDRNKIPEVIVSNGVRRVVRGGKYLNDFANLDFGTYELIFLINASANALVDRVVAPSINRAKS